MSNKGLKDIWFIFPIIILAISLLIRIYWTFINLNEYPFESMPDAGNHITFLYFLAEYGFHQIVPNYWNGFVLFSRYTPGWHFLSLPLYYLTKNATSAVFLSLIQSLSLGLIFILILGRFMKISILKRIAFFLLFFASPVALDYIQIGRYPELTGWVLFIPFFTLIIWYKNHKIDKKFLLFIPLYSLIFLTHVYVLFVSSFMIISLFLIKKFKEKTIIVLSFLLSLILTSFWWHKAFVFIWSNIDTHVDAGAASLELLTLGSLISYNTLILTGFLLAFYFDFKSCRNNRRKELLFYSPLLVLSLLMLTRLIAFIPILNVSWIMPYNMFFLFLTLFLFFSIDLKTMPVVLKKIVPIFLIILATSMFVFSFIRVEYSKPVHPLLKEEFLSILPDIEGRYITISTESTEERIFNEPLLHKFPEIYDTGVTDYAIINYNLSTPFGTIHPGGFVPKPIRETFKQIYGCGGPWEECPKEIKALDCSTIKDVVTKQNVRNLVSSGEGCNLLKECGFTEKIKKSEVCLFIDETILL